MLTPWVVSAEAGEALMKRLPSLGVVSASQLELPQESPRLRGNSSPPKRSRVDRHTEVAQCPERIPSLERDFPEGEVDLISVGMVGSLSK